MTALLTLSLREFCARVPMSRTQYYRLDKHGAFDTLKLPFLKNRFSVVKVDEWINGRKVTPMHGLRAAS